MFNLNAAFSLVEGSRKAILNTKESSAHYFQRPDNNYTVLDTNRTSLAGSGGRMQIQKSLTSIRLQPNHERGFPGSTDGQ